MQLPEMPRGSPAPAAARGRFAKLARRYSMRIGVLGVAVFIWVLFLIGSPRTFLAGDIYVAFMSTTPFFALIAIPLTLVIITGEIDLLSLIHI